jgi:predicted ATPase
VSAFVGRAHELAVLAEVAKSASEGVAAGLVIGEPGSGKSRLLVEARGRTRLAHSMEVLGYQPERHVPLAAAAQLVRKLSEVPEHGTRLEALLLHADEARALDPVRIFEAAHRSFRTLEPALLAIDDLQWMDDLSYALCHYLIRAARESRQRLAIFCMPEKLRRPPATASLGLNRDPVSLRSGRALRRLGRSWRRGRVHGPPLVPRLQIARALLRRPPPAARTCNT